MSYQPQFIGDIDLSEETLAHYGVKGMKWGKRKAREVADAIKKRVRNSKWAKDRRHRKYVASHLAKDIVDGRRQIDRPYGDVKNDKYNVKYGRKYTWTEAHDRASRPRASLDASLYKSYKGQKVVKANTSKDGWFDPDGYRYTTYGDLKNAIASEERRKKKK